MSVGDDYSGCKTVDKPREPEKGRELFGVQLEVINLLLEAERRKLCVLQRDLKVALQEGGSIKSKEHQKQELISAIHKIQGQYDHLEKECKIHVIGAFKAHNIGKTPDIESNIWGQDKESSSPIRGEGGPADAPLPALPPPSTDPNKLADGYDPKSAKLRPPVPPKRSTLSTTTRGSLPSPSALSVDSSDDKSPLPTSHLITVKTNILSPTPKLLPTPKSKNQRVLSTFLPALPPKVSKSPLVQSPNFPRAQEPEPSEPEESPPFSPSNTQPPLPHPPVKPARKTPPSEQQTPPPSTEITVAPITEGGETTPPSEVSIEEPRSVAVDEESNEIFGEPGDTSTIKRAPKKLNVKEPVARTKSPIRVSFADEAQEISRTKRATKELQSIIKHIESVDCSPIEKVITRRKSAGSHTPYRADFDLAEGYTSCCEEGTKIVTKKPRIKKKLDGPILCNCPLDSLVFDSRRPVQRPNSSIGDYSSSKSKSSRSGPFWNGPSRNYYANPGLGLVVTISSDGIDQEPKRTVHFISGGPAVNFGLGGTLGRYTKSKTQDKGLKVAGNGFSSDVASDFEDRPKTPSSRPKTLSDGTPRPIALLEKQKSSGDIELRQRHFSATLTRKKSPGEVLEHFGKLATSVTSLEISKIPNEKLSAVKSSVQNFEKIVEKNTPKAFENFRTVPPTSFNNPASYSGSAFVQYVRETLPAPSAYPQYFDKYSRLGSGRFDKSSILPQQPKSDKPSAFERLCGDKIYSSRRGIYGKKSAAGSLDCVAWEKKPQESAQPSSQPLTDSRPSSCTYEIAQNRGVHPNYAYISPIDPGKPQIGVPRTSKKGIIEPEPSRPFTPRSLDQFRLAPGCKTDLSTLYSGVFYAKPVESVTESARLLDEYGIRVNAMGGNHSGSEGGRRTLTGEVASIAAATRIPEEPAPGVVVHLPAQYHPLDDDFVPDDSEAKSNRSQPAIGIRQTPKTRPTIFGTVASEQHPPKDGSSRRTNPQTSHGVANGDNGSSQDNTQDSTPERDHALVYRDGNLISGSLEALIQHMVPTSEYYPDRAYLFAFLLSSRLFIKPHELLGEVCALCDSQQHLGGKDPPPKERLGHFIPHFVQLLAEWTETFPYDFRDERVMVHVRSITQKCVTIEPAIRKEVSSLLQNLLVRLTTLEKYEEFLQRITVDATTDSIEALSSADVTELCSNPNLLAQQLTHIELERLSYIGPEEFVQAFAKENPHLETSFKDMKKTRNLESYVAWFNRLSYLVATEVCKHVKKKQRVRVVEFWIETARECFNIGNFNSLMAIIAGLNMSPVARLKKTWSKIQSGKFSILEHQMDPSSNFSSYRSTLKAAMWRSAGATDLRQRIVIPFFSLLVKDLYFLNEGCSSRLPNGHINFEKFWQLAKQVTEFITWKQVSCPFEKITKVITFLQASPVLTENALALASFECEPPENNHEKERYKSLK